jgi:hypothetical protein
LVLHPLGAGAEEYELVVDAEHGFLLRAEARLHGNPFQVLEMTEVRVDEELPVSVFIPENPEGEGFQFFDPVRFLLLSELPSAVPFKVFVPAEPPGGAGLVSVRGARPREGIPPSATFAYTLPTLGDKLWVHESIEQEQRLPTWANPGEVWSQVDSFQVATDETTEPATCKIVLEREGTHIRLESTGMSIHQLLALARSLVVLTPGKPPAIS